MEEDGGPELKLIEPPLDRCFMYGSDDGLETDSDANSESGSVASDSA